MDADCECQSEAHENECGIAEAPAPIDPPGGIPPIMQFFGYKHLPQRLQDVSAIFCEAAYQLLWAAAPGDQRDLALQRLLDAKDAAVRAAL